MSQIPRNLLHGSSIQTIDRLSPTYGLERSPFGPALYLTEDPQVAGCYVKRSGAIYEVNISGNEELTIDMNSAWEELSVAARLSITRLFKVANVPLPKHRESRAMLDAVTPIMSKRERNNFLASEGIWMLHGYIYAMEHSGLCDRGVQYALIDDSAIKAQRFWDSSAALSS